MGKVHWRVSYFFAPMGFLQAAELRWEQFERRLQFEFSRAMRPKPWKLRALLVLSAALVALSWLSATHLWSLTEPNPWFMDAVLSVIMPQRLVKGLLSSFSAAGVTTSSGPPDQLQHRLAMKLSSFLVPPPLVRSVCVWGSWLANVLSTAALAAALVSWHVLAVAAVLLFTIVGTTCDTVLAVGWAEYVTASLLVLRAWALVLCLVGSMFFAFGTLPLHSASLSPYTSSA